jgi:hypothetical protein
MGAGGDLVDVVAPRWVPRRRCVGDLEGIDDGE